MTRPWSRAVGLTVVALFAVCGGCAGLVVGHFQRLPGQRPRVEIGEFPLPHHVPKYEGGISLRFAMVHDVLHERYPRHGAAYYRERNRLVRQKLAGRPGRIDDATLALLDDLGAGLDALQEHDEAVRVLRDKLRRQEGMDPKDPRRYTTYANLGTFLIHGSARAALAGDAWARHLLSEGLAFIRRALEVNPKAHFGREAWQTATAEYLLAVSGRPSLVLDFRLVGNALTDEIYPAGLRSFTQMYGTFGSNKDVAAYLRDSQVEPHGNSPSMLRERYITEVGADPGWAQAVLDAHGKPVPFDEPTLGIVGMWRLGGGASPHFALALGEIMLRVGQRYIAWCAYERAAGMADDVSSDADIRRRFVAHCRRRQAVIERGLPADDVAALRPRFEAELAHGRRYQEAYQAYEAERIRAGASLDDPHF